MKTSCPSPSPGLLVYTGVIVLLVTACAVHCVDMELTDKHNTELGPCQACKTVVKSFLKGMEATSRGKHEGGDADWESKKLKDYSRSEVRLADIYSTLCHDVKVGKNQCHHLASEWEELIESEWWQLWPRPDLHHWLCVEQRRLCCPEHHYGAQCLPCAGGVPPCSGHGRCKGAGSRKGSGRCSCDAGYAGDVCDQCNTTTHYTVQQDEAGVQCAPCHRACKTCTGPGVKLCVQCADGYMWSAEEGCVDLDECRSSNPCRRNQFCVNNIGSYSCLDCDRSCTSCTGDGPDMCIECAEHFIKQDNACVDGRLIKREKHATTARYLTYLGLAVACGILTQKSRTVAGTLAAAVVAYISVAEYQLASEQLAQ